jgi:hypothetical protein
MWKNLTDGLGELFAPLGTYVLDLFYEWLNGSNSIFGKCFFALADTAVKRGKGPGQWIMKLALSFLANESLKRPSIVHWLIYGQNVYTKVNEMEQAQFDLITSINDTSGNWFETTNAEIGTWELDDNNRRVWKGMESGSEYFT